MDFKDIVQNDIYSVFLQDIEFADRKEVNGILIPIIEDDSMLEKAESITGGIYNDNKTIYVSAEHIKKPKQGSILTIDKASYIVVSAADEMGVLSIVLQRNKAR